MRSTLLALTVAAAIAAVPRTTAQVSTYADVDAACLAAYCAIRQASPAPAPTPEPAPEPDEGVDVQQSASLCTTVHQDAPECTKELRRLTYVCYSCLRLGTLEWPVDEPLPPRVTCRECGGTMYRDPIEEAATEEDERRPRRTRPRPRPCPR